MNNSDQLFIAKIKEMNQSMDSSDTKQDEEIIQQWQLNQNILRDKFNDLLD